MSKPAITGILSAVLIMGLVAAAGTPSVADAQQVESEQSFNRRMVSRLDRIISDVRRIKRESGLEEESGDEKRPRSRPTESYGGMSQQLDSLEDMAREQRRDLESIGRMRGTTTYDTYTYQREVMYRVRGMEYQLRQIKNWVREAEAREAESSPARNDMPADTPEDENDDGMTDEEWAEQWAEADR